MLRKLARALGWILATVLFGPPSGYRCGPGAWSIREKPDASDLPELDEPDDGYDGSLW